MFDAIGDKQLEINVLYYAMGKDVTNVVQQAMQQYMQTAFSTMQQRLNDLDQESYEHLSEVESEQSDELLEAQAIAIIQDCLNGMMPAMADCLEQFYPIDRQALGL